MPDLIVPTLDISDVSVYYGHKCAVENVSFNAHSGLIYAIMGCLLYTSVAADDTACVDLGGRRGS